jgi:uncharacterized protein (DUF488 family)
LSAQQHRVLTVGHSTHPIEEFLALLKTNGVTAIADVRSTPYSRFNPQFNRETLERTLKTNNMAYVFLGRELGARSDDASCYESGRVQFRRLAETALFRSGLQRVIKGAESHQIALMCAEKDPLECHRTLLVSRELAAQSVSISHILADGSLEAHADAMTRLLSVVGLPATDLFRTEADLLAEASDLQERRIAYVDDELQNAVREGGA